MKIFGLFIGLLHLQWHRQQANASFVRPPFQTTRNAERVLQSTKETESTATASTKTLKTPTKISSYKTADCDDSNIPPSLSNLITSLHSLTSGSDIRGTFVDHPRRGSVLNVSHILDKSTERAFTPFAAYCYGRAFAKMVQIRSGKGSATYVNGFKMVNTDFDSWGNEFVNSQQVKETVICVGRDPRPHGVRIADSLCRGIESVDSVKALYTGIASTPSMFEFCRSDKCDGGIMVSSCHLKGKRRWAWDSLYLVSMFWHR